MAITVKILKGANGKRRAFYQTAGVVSRIWHSMPVAQAEKALRGGFVSIGLSQNASVICG